MAGRAPVFDNERRLADGFPCAGCAARGPSVRQVMPSGPDRKEMDMWSKPEYTEMRFGFEVTMYIANR